MTKLFVLLLFPAVLLAQQAPDFSVRISEQPRTSSN
jgi:hypothetical protein